MQAKLLLFLHQVRRLELRDATSGVSRTLTRRSDPCDASIVVLAEHEVRAAGGDESEGGALESSSEQRWLVITVALRDLKVERLGIKSTELTVAFPLPDPMAPYARPAS